MHGNRLWHTSDSAISECSRGKNPVEDDETTRVRVDSVGGRRLNRSRLPNLLVVTTMNHRSSRPFAHPHRQGRVCAVSLFALSVAMVGCGKDEGSPGPGTQTAEPTTPVPSNTVAPAPSSGPVGSPSSPTNPGPTGNTNPTPTPTGSSGPNLPAPTSSAPVTSAPTSNSTTEPAVTSTEPVADSSEPSVTSEPSNDTEPNAPGPVGCDQLLLCEDFEGVAAGGSPDPAKWSLVANYTYDIASSDLVKVSSEKKRSGNQALRVAANGLAGAIAQVPAQTFYLRAYMQVDAAPLGPVLAGIGTDHNSELRFRIQQNSWATINIIPGDAVLPQAAREGNCPDCPAIKPNEWFCVEMFVDGAGKNAGLWVNEVEVFNGSVSGDFPTIGNPTRVRLGTMDLQGGSTGVWVDDVAIGTSRIGCDG